jgi:thiol-disulfide isomerase/thioredoxin
MVSKFRTARRRIIVGGVLVFLISLLLSASAPATFGQRKTAHTRRKPVAKPARAINADELKVLLKRDGNRPLLVNWWATWCNPCREEFPDLVKIDNSYRAKGLEVIAISLDDFADLKTAVPQFLRTMKATMPVYLLNVADPDPVITFVDGKWGGDLPATFLYNSQGEIVYKHFGRVNTQELRTEIEKLVSSKQ